MLVRNGAAGSLLALLMISPLVFSCNSSDSSNTSTGSTSSPATGTTVQVTATATDSDQGDQSNLHYRWAATAGSIQNINAATTTWVVPPGSGLQFAYVVVSDGKGGYTEGRAAALTFSPQPAAPASASPITPDALACAPGCQSESVWGAVVYDQFSRNVYLPNVTVELNGTSYATDMKGEFFISNLSSGSHTATVKIPGNPDQPFTVFTGSTSRSNYNLLLVSLPNTSNIAGSVRMADHSFCGFRNEFFTKIDGSDSNLFTEPVYGTAELLDAGNQPLNPSSSSRINYYGDFLIMRSDPTPANVKVRIACEKNGPTTDSTESVSNPGAGGARKFSSRIIIPNNKPKITGISVLLNGRDVGRPDLPKPRTVFASKTDPDAPHFGGDPDLIAEIIDSPGDDTFFTYKGLDTRKSACAYYQAIGAVTKCDLNGYPQGDQLTLERWRSQFHLSPFSSSDPSLFAPDGKEVRIQYINRSDLNLTRDMQAVKLSNGDIAYNVCNYPGPQNVHDPLGAPDEVGPQTQPDIQDDIDLAIENARRGIGLIVCVAMDYSPTSRVTRFYTFGTTGNLLLSVSLDGRREKFMPGSCTACHGGTAYGGQYPIDGSRGPDLQSRWQPFDMANLKVRFSSTDELNAIKSAVKTLNQRMVGGGVIPPDPRYDPMITPRTRELITNWYINGGLDQDPDFIPSTVLNNFNGVPDLLDLYHKVLQPGCQTCHAAQGTASSDIGELIDQVRVCGGSQTLELNHKMPNSLVPFERFWLDPTLPPLLGCGTKPDHDPAL